MENKKIEKKMEHYFVQTSIKPILDENNEIIEFIAVLFGYHWIRIDEREYSKEFSITSENMKDISYLSKYMKRHLIKVVLLLELDR